MDAPIWAVSYTHLDVYKRQLPMLTTDYGDATDFENRQREQTFRSVLSWDHMKSNWKLGVKGGYIHTWMALSLIHI